MLANTEMKEAQIVITSLLNKCEKSVIKLKPNSAQHTLLENRINALRVSLKLIEIEIKK